MPIFEKERHSAMLLPRFAKIFAALSAKRNVRPAGNYKTARVHPSFDVNLGTEDASLNVCAPYRLDSCGSETDAVSPMLMAPADFISASRQCWPVLGPSRGERQQAAIQHTTTTYPGHRITSLNY
eukprot:1483195-Pleurochrysis_carterae.AAC.1